MPLFEGHRDKGLERLFIELPDSAKTKVVWKWPDQQIIQYSQLNVDLDYQAVFTNLGQVIGVMGPGRYRLDEGASLTLGWLVDRLTGNAYYDAEVYFVATHDIPDVKFGGPVDNLTDGPSGLVVTLRVFGELAYRVVDPSLLLAKLIGTGAGGDPDTVISTWVTDQTLAAVRAVVPDIVGEHGVLAMGQVQDATAQAACDKVNQALAPYGLSVTAFGELNVNLPDHDAQQLKQFAATKAYSGLAGSFDSAVRGEAALEIANGVASGNVGAQPGIMAGMVMGLPVSPASAPPVSPASAPPVSPASAPPVSPASASPVPPASASPLQGVPSSVPEPPAPPAPETEVPGAHFCTQCGARLPAEAHFCANCGGAVAAVSA